MKQALTRICPRRRCSSTVADCNYALRRRPLRKSGHIHRGNDGLEHWPFLFLPPFIINNCGSAPKHCGLNAFSYSRKEATNMLATRKGIHRLGMARAVAIEVLTCGSLRLIEANINSTEDKLRNALTPRRTCRWPQWALKSYLEKRRRGDEISEWYSLTEPPKGL